MFQILKGTIGRTYVTCIYTKNPVSNPKRHYRTHHHDANGVCVPKFQILKGTIGQTY